MRAWLPERQVYGPEPATERDTEALNRVFADAFTDRYRRDGLVGVRVPYLNPQVWRYALRDAGAGAMLWRDESGEVVAFNIAHRSGSEGWMGPLAVRPDRQGMGVGKTVVRAAVDWLVEQGGGGGRGGEVATLGLETMPRTVENIGFYGRLGFSPAYLTVTMTNDIATRGHPAPALLSQRKGAAAAQAVAAARRLVSELVAGYDFTREILLTVEFGLGDLALVEGDDGLRALVLWHAAPLAEGQERGEEDRSHDQANGVVDEERGEQAPADHDGEEQPPRRPGALEHELRGPLEESSYLEVADDQHHAEQEDEHVEVHGGVRVLERQHAEHDHRDGPDQAGRGPIEVDERQPLDGDEEIGCDEDQETGGHTNAECGMD